MICVVNVVGSGDLGFELDIEQVAADLTVPYSEYNPTKYHGLYVRVQEKGPLVTIYQSGKYIISGCSNFGELEETNNEFLDQLSDLAEMGQIGDTKFKVQNVVCTAELRESIDLNTLSIELGLNVVEYEPEQFPGLVYRPIEHPVVLLVFSNGKVVITGASDLSVAEKAFEHIQSHIESLP